ncbi:MAG: hypothetical protein KAU20_01380 [Nanoarchaeota archaeon]|nr:hypothetical protein [Nanoarchaeota archaeon]
MPAKNLEYVSGEVKTILEDLLKTLLNLDYRQKGKNGLIGYRGDIHPHLLKKVKKYGINHYRAYRITNSVWWYANENLLIEKSDNLPPTSKNYEDCSYWQLKGKAKTTDISKTTDIILNNNPEYLISNYLGVEHVEIKGKTIYF